MQEEIFPIVDSEGNTIGQATRTECHNGTFLLHPVVHLHVFNSQGELYLQKRAVSKKIQPGRWDTSVGGHVDYGESINEALRREAREELGIKDFTPTLVKVYQFRSSIEQELVYVYQCTYDGPINPDKEEIAEGRFWTKSEIDSAIGKEILTPNFESESTLVLSEEESV